MDINALSLDTLLPAITAATGLLAAGAAATQLSYRRRMMRAASWAQQQIDNTAGEHRRHLQLMKKWAESEVVASTLVPAWIFLEPIGLSSVGFLAQLLKNQPHLLTLLTFLLFTMSFRRTIRLYLERRRCASDYYTDHPVHPVNIGLLSQMEGGTQREIKYALLIAAGLTGLSASFGHYIRNGSSVFLLITFLSSALVAHSVKVVRRWDRHPYLARI
ncbi:hypothetical protein [Schaalia odontolytica]|uniref:Uncharacterized protein n=1 Tax=Schaalia odontolytica TaxID=1660 RepID=A0A2X0VLV0_9ACTO|nr:hypothetical protein [Schaalia odontolytica]WMS27583.1 hypothetical protein RDV55_00615 [Schaalia odontolytica]SPT54892.1 Uncharacterised protein [Schaalia odontolytica]